MTGRHALAVIAAIAAAVVAPHATAQQTPGPGPLPIVTAIDSALARLARSFRADPLITWGPTPAGSAHADRSVGFDVQHQVVRLRIDHTRRVVVGSTSVRIAALQRLDAVVLVAEQIRVASVKGPRGVVLQFANEGAALTIQLHAPLGPRATTTLDIEYESAPRPEGVEFADATGAVWTVAGVAGVRSWVPTTDVLAERATWELHVTARPHETVIAGGRAAGSGRVASGDVEWHWRQETPAPLAGMSFAVGPHLGLRDVWRGVPISYWSYGDSIEATWRAFGKIPRMIEAFSLRTGVLYPWSKYEIAVVRGASPPAGAAVSTAFVPDLVLRPQTDTTVSADVLVAREVARQWFGGVYTAVAWRDVWMQEALPEALAQSWIDDQRGPETGALVRQEMVSRAIDADRRMRRPLVFDRWRDTPAELVESGHARDRGGAVLQLLRHEVGDSLFWFAISRTLATQRGGVVGTDDLKRSLEAVSRRDLTRFFSQWVYGAGVPAFRVGWGFDSTSRALTLTARQMQPRDSVTGLFDVTLLVTVWTETGEQRHVVTVGGDSSAVRLQLDGAPRAIRWGTGGWTPMVVDFPRTTAMLIHQLERDRDVLGRLEAIDLLTERVGEEHVRDALAAAAARDTAPFVRERAAKALLPAGAR